MTENANICGIGQSQGAYPEYFVILEHGCQDRRKLEESSGAGI